MMDAYDLWERREAAHERRLARLPECECCGHKIQDEELWDIDGKLYHEGCAIELFRKWTEDYET